MKIIVIFLLFLLISPSCFAEKGEENALNQVIKSWHKYSEESIKQLNNTIQTAHNNGEAWVLDPNKYIFNLFTFRAIKSYIVEFDYDTDEQPEYLRIQATVDNITGDDSVLGFIVRIVLLHDETDKSKIWRLSLVKRSYRCHRAEDKNVFTSKSCP
jgi:hypothetical protein